jgi:hypothetical protein
MFTPPISLWLDWQIYFSTEDNVVTASELSKFISSLNDSEIKYYTEQRPPEKPSPNFFGHCMAHIRL